MNRKQNERYSIRECKNRSDKKKAIAFYGGCIINAPLNLPIMQWLLCNKFIFWVLISVYIDRVIGFLLNLVTTIEFSFQIDHKHTKQNY